MPVSNLQVLIVDDSIVYRNILTKIVESIPNVMIADTASNGKMALHKLAEKPIDIVLLDIEMPIMNGLDALKIIQPLHPEVKVIIISSVNKESAISTIKALELGAVDFIQKPEGTYVENFGILTTHLGHLFQHLQSKNKIRKTSRDPKVSEARPTHASPVMLTSTGQSVVSPTLGSLAPLPKRFDVLAIGASTGGPHALIKVISKFPPDLGIPILLVQHMPPFFTTSFAKSLGGHTVLPVREAEDGEPIQPNSVYLAPGGQHMTAVKKPNVNGFGFSYNIQLNSDLPEHGCRPSVDVLFRSLAESYGSNMLAVVMTGMGCDGRDGVRAMKRKGCLCLTQDEASCVVYGMPNAVVEAGLSDETVPLDRLHERIVALIKEGYYSKPW